AGVPTAGLGGVRHGRCVARGGDRGGRWNVRGRQGGGGRLLGSSSGGRPSFGPGGGLGRRLPRGRSFLRRRGRSGLLLRRRLDGGLGLRLEQLLQLGDDRFVERREVRADGNPHVRESVEDLLALDLQE